MKVSELTGAALDWAVAKCEGAHSEAAAYLDDIYGLRYLDEAFWAMWEPSTNWAQGGPIIEREKIEIYTREINWVACREISGDENWDGNIMLGPTPLIAAMRCYVASKLGDDVEIPAELK